MTKNGAKSVTFPLAITAALLISGAASWARTVGVGRDPAVLVRLKYRAIKEITSTSSNREVMETRIRHVMDSFVDYRELSRRAMGSWWKGLERRQRREFVSEFKKMIQRSYVRRFNPDRHFEVEFTKQTQFGKNGATAFVYTVVRSGKSEARVDYAFVRKSGRWLAYDVIIDEVSMMKNYRRQFHKIMSKEGYEGLISRIKGKNRKADGQGR